MFIINEKSVLLITELQLVIQMLYCDINVCIFIF